MLEAEATHDVGKPWNAILWGAGLLSKSVHIFYSLLRSCLKTKFKISIFSYCPPSTERWCPSCQKHWLLLLKQGQCMHLFLSNVPACVNIADACLISPQYYSPQALGHHICSERAAVKSSFLSRAQPEVPVCVPSIWYLGCLERWTKEAASEIALKRADLLHFSTCRSSITCLASPLTKRLPSSIGVVGWAASVEAWLCRTWTLDAARRGSVSLQRNYVI